MVYKYHQWVREASEYDSSIWPEDVNPDNDKRIRNLRRSKPRIPYTLEIESTSYWGNYEREFLAYSIGILDDVQMRIHHSEEELEMFWSEVFNRKPPKFKEALEEYELLRDFLLETYQECDDWEQLTFYTIDWDILHKNGSNVLKIQLAKPLSKELEDLIIPRMRAFFTKKVYEYLKPEDDIISITLCDRKGYVVKEY